MIHELKILPQYYFDIKHGVKKFELRKNDRDYKVGDIVVLKPWDGEMFLDLEPFAKRIKYILKDCPEYGLMDGYAILGF